VHLINAAKYFSKLIPPIIVAFDSSSNKLSESHFWVFIIFNLIATIYVTVWDYYMDWGLFRCYNKKGNYLLREKITFKPIFYYFAIVTNTILRFFWIIGIFTFTYDTKGWEMFDKLKLLLFFGMMAELIRRTQWTILRIENEFINNFEGYRLI